MCVCVGGGDLCVHAYVCVCVDERERGEERECAVDVTMHQCIDVYLCKA